MAEKGEEVPERSGISPPGPQPPGAVSQVLRWMIRRDAA